MSSAYYMSENKKWVACPNALEKQVWGEELVQLVCNQARLAAPTVHWFGSWPEAHAFIVDKWIYAADKLAVYDLRVERGTCYMGDRGVIANVTNKPNDIFMILATKDYGFDSTATGVTPMNYLEAQKKDHDRVGNWRLICKTDDVEACKLGLHEFSNTSRINWLLHGMTAPSYQQPMPRSKRASQRPVMVIDAEVVDGDGANPISMLVEAAAATDSDERSKQGAEPSDKKQPKSAPRRPPASRAETRRTAQPNHGVNSIPQSQALHCTVNCRLDVERIGGGNILQAGELNLFDGVSHNGRAFVAKLPDGKTFSHKTPAGAALVRGIALDLYTITTTGTTTSSPEASPDKSGSNGKRARSDMQQPTDMSSEVAAERLGELNKEKDRIVLAFEENEDEKNKILDAMAPKAQDAKTKLRTLTSRPPDFSEVAQISTLSEMLSKLNEGEPGRDELQHAIKKMQSSLDKKEAEHQRLVEEATKELKKYTDLGVVVD